MAGTRPVRAAAAASKEPGGMTLHAIEKPAGGKRAAVWAEPRSVAAPGSRPEPVCARQTGKMAGRNGWNADLHPPFCSLGAQCTLNSTLKSAAATVYWYGATGGF